MSRVIRRPSRRRLRPILAAALALVLGLAARGHAQVGAGGPDGIRDAFNADFVRRDLPLIIDRLGLEPTQVPILEAFYRDYEDAFGAGVERLRARMAELRPQRPIEPEDAARRRDEIQQEITRLRRDLQEKARTIRDPDVVRGLTEEYMRQLEPLYEAMRELTPNVSSRDEVNRMMAEMNGLVAEWEVEKAALRDAFLANLENILLDEQRQRWPPLMRLLRRQKTLPEGVLSGESLNLFTLLAEFGLSGDETPELREALEGYDIALDEALRARNEHERATRKALADGVQRRAAETVMPIVAERLARHLAVRDVNLRALGAVSTTLGEREPDFLSAAYRRAFPRVYRATRTARAIDGTLRIDDLDPTVSASVQELRSYYDEEVARRNAEIRRLTLDYEPRAMRRQYESMFEQAGEGDALREDPVRLAYDERAAFERQVQEQLRSMLTPEQSARVPGLRAALTGPDAPKTIMTRFDADGDGTLDAEERAAVREYFRKQAEATPPG